MALETKKNKQQNAKSSKLKCMIGWKKNIGFEIEK
jgi:hypothetical protein